MVSWSAGLQNLQEFGITSPEFRPADPHPSWARGVTPLAPVTFPPKCHLSGSRPAAALYPPGLTPDRSPAVERTPAGWGRGMQGRGGLAEDYHLVKSSKYGGSDAVTGHRMLTTRIGGDAMRTESGMFGE